MPGTQPPARFAAAIPPLRFTEPVPTYRRRTCAARPPRPGTAGRRLASRVITPEAGTANPVPCADDGIRRMADV